MLYRLLKPSSIADCLPDELPYGWELAHDPHMGTYFINHLTSELSLISALITNFELFRLRTDSVRRTLALRQSQNV